MNIRIKDLEFSYHHGNFRLSITDLKIASGSKTAFVGASGSGKTTLLQLMGGILVPPTGSVFLDEIDITQLTDVERRCFRISRIGYVFQGFELLEYLTGLENILLPCRINNRTPLDQDRLDRARFLARSAEVESKLHMRPDQLSQGERQRMAICRALLTQPGLLLADEPTGNLDPANKQRILELLFEQVEWSSSTLVMVTHDHSLLKNFDACIDFTDFHKETGKEAALP